MMAVIDALVPPAIITKVPMPSACVNKTDIVNGRRSYVSNLFGLLHQPIQLPCHAYVCGWCLKEWICVTVRYSVTSLQLAELKQRVQLLGDIVMHCGTDVVASLQHNTIAVSTTSHS